MANANKKGFSLGASVAFNKDLDWLYPSSMNQIFEVADAQLLNGRYVYSLRPIREGLPPAISHTGISPCDLHEVVS
jgi:hypothetical protein